MTSFISAAASSRHEYGKRSTIVDIKAFGSAEDDRSKTFLRGKKILLKQPELAKLPEKLQFYCRGVADLNMTTTLLHLKTSGTLCSVPAWAHPDETVLQCVRAAQTFHDKPWFDTVSVLSDTNEVWYCELRLLFQYAGQNLVFVQWYDKAPPDSGDILSKYGCISLKKLDAYDVLPLEALTQREFVVPDYRSRVESVDGNVTYNRYHVSAFKSVRSSVGFKQSPVDEYGNDLS
jgi:hypothetical protein